MLDFWVDVDDPGDDSGLVLAERYELLRLIGTGATALVYEGVDRRTQRPIAVKVLIPSARAQVGDFFGQEARIAARVRSPHLVQASDFGEDQERLFIVFDLLPGQPFAERLRGETLPPCSEICMVGLHVLNALAALHDAGIVHRDVKPDNIFVAQTVGATLHATLLDVGFAAVLPPRRMTIAPEPVRAVFGTAGYIAPEIFGGHPPDPRSDLYSLGAVLYEALTGQPVPNFRRSPQLVLPSPQAFRPEVPDALAALVLNALSDIEARFASAEEMALALASALRELERPARHVASPITAATASPPIAMAAEPTASASPPAVPAMTSQQEEPAVPSRVGRWVVLGAALLGAVGLVAVLRAGAADTMDPEPGLRAELAASQPDLAEVRPSDGMDTEPAGDSAEPNPSSVAVAVAPPVKPLPEMAEALEGVRTSLRACATAPFFVELERDAGAERFGKIDVVGDEATAACARPVLESLRFAPGTAQVLTKEFRP
jgi:hypothetical protein